MAIQLYANILKSIRQHPYTWLLLITVCYYSLYLHDVFLNLNTLLSSSADDSLKNYFTYVFQIKNSPSLLHFTGFNYPFGEHVVYTDCQPLLTFLLRQVPFAHDYSIGILHFLMFASILVCPLIYLAIFRLLRFPNLAAFTISLAITILSPQYFRIYCGHYALAYAFVIPFTLLQLLRYFHHENQKIIIGLFFYNCLLFLIHPYYGLGITLFCFISLFFMFLFKRGHRLKYFLQSVCIGVVPIVLFRVFMALSDQHEGRSPEPFGNTAFISELSSFLVPCFGPFSQFLTQLIGAFPQHFEGYSYLGLGFILIALIGLPVVLVYIRKLSLHLPILGLLGASVFFLILSLGIQYNIQEWTGTKLHSLNQFRAMGRFSWFLYYFLPVALFAFLYEILSKQLGSIKSVRVINALGLFYLAFNLYEGHAYFKMYDGVMWEDRNVFNPKQLLPEEKHLLEAMKEKNAKAIIPLPTFYIGSEVYERSFPLRPMFLSSIYSYHSGLPILSSSMSRTSVSETQAGINFLNTYQRDRSQQLADSNGTYFLVRSHDPLYEDEKRVWRVSQPYFKTDTSAFGFVNTNALSRPILDTILLEIRNTTHYPPDSNSVIFLGRDNRKPFLPANALSYEMVYETDTGDIRSGSYIMSFHYYTKDKTFLGVANSMVVAKKRGDEYNWQEFISLKIPSGFSNGYSIYEHRLDIDGRYAYEFFIHGGDDFEYQVANFLLRPAHKSVRVISNQRDTLLNNFPR